MERMEFDIEIDGLTDERGRTPFTLLWVDRYGDSKAQCFRAKVEETEARMVNHGYYRTERRV